LNLVLLVEREGRQDAVVDGRLDGAPGDAAKGHGALGDRVDVVTGLVRALVEQLVELRKSIPTTFQWACL